MDVSVIIVNYNTLAITQNCINSVFEKTIGVSFEVIVVDNASRDGSADALSKDSRIRFIRSERNGGFGYGNNLGMKVAKGKYLFLLNSDTLLRNNAIKAFFEYAESHEPKMVYGCWLRGGDDTYRHSYFYFPAFTVRQYLHRVIHRQDYSPSWNERDVECVCGADMFLPRTAFEETGGFDENIFLYGEEGEWQYRLMCLGYGRRIITGPEITHLEGKSSEGNSTISRVGWKSHFYILHKWMNRPTYILARLYYFVQLKVLRQNKK